MLDRRPGSSTEKRPLVNGRRSSVLAAALILVAWCGGSSGAQEAAPVDLTILAINDFHGNLRPPPSGIRIADPSDKTKKIAVPAGGAEHLATLIKELRAGRKNSIFVAAGDNIGATPFLSALSLDEAAIQSLSLMGLDLAAVGNHEFDKGKDELLRMQNGGCSPTKGCRGPQPFSGAKFRYLAASTVDVSSGQTLLPPFAVKEFDGIPVAFIGLTLKGTPDMVTPSGVAGLRFGDEAETINALVPQIRARGIEAIVVVIHEGGFPTGDYNECPALGGPIVGIVHKLDKAVDLVVSGHTHRAYVCEIDGRLVTSADQYGTVVTQIDVKLDPRTRDVISAKANNLIVRTDTYAKDPDQTALIAAYDLSVKPLAERKVGNITATLTRSANAAGESPLGAIIADAQLAATRQDEDGGAVIAFMNPGGVRNDIVKRAEDGSVTFADLFGAQPFSNSLVTLTLTGAQIKELLEQQWAILPNTPRILQVSKGFSFAWDSTRPQGDHVLADSITLNGQPIDPTASYRVTVNSFLASGGDGFAVLTKATAPRTGGPDVDALVAYFQANSPVSPGEPGRVRRTN
jgi:5'-nucleotidase